MHYNFIISWIQNKCRYTFPDFLLIRNSELFPEANEPLISREGKGRVRATRKRNEEKEESKAERNSRPLLNKLARLRAAVCAKVFSSFHLGDFARPAAGSSEFIKNARRAHYARTPRKRSRGAVSEWVAAIRTNLGDLMSATFQPA